MKMIVLAAGLFALAGSASAESWSIVSPNGMTQISLQLADLGGVANYPQGECLYYRVEHGPQGQRAVVIGDSPLGLRLKGADLAAGLKFESAAAPRRIEESYEMPHGKRRLCRNQANQQTFVFRNATGQSLELDVRAYDNGVTFRYRVPTGNGVCETLQEELTGFAIPSEAKLWMAPSDIPGTYTPAYETNYENGIAVGTPAPRGVGWEFPMLLQTAGGQWALITEANVQENFCGTRFNSVAPHGVYRIALPDPGEGNGQGAVQPSAPTPWEMPWRVIIVGNSLGEIVESTLVTDVASPSRLKDTSWIRPGRVAWSWWSDNASPRDGQKQRKFVDFAAEMGWEYILVDANWDLMDNGNIHDVLRYAKQKGVSVLLWYNSGGPHNIVTEKPRDTLTYPEVRRFELDLLKSWGVCGIKVDFFQSDKQNVIGLYQGIMHDAAERQIMVNFHGCTLPRGWDRTWPHLMSMEAVRGEENYIFGPKFPQEAPVQSTILPFTRNVVGPMDYTPVAFSNNKYAHLTTVAHELALSVVFESGWLHFADKAEAYLSLPDAPKQFLKQVPVAWDDTRLVAGYPGKFVVLARRKGPTWYVAGINGENQLREETVEMGSWLPPGRYEVARIGDGSDARHFADDVNELPSSRAFRVKFLPYGGFVATLKPMK